MGRSPSFEDCLKQGSELRNAYDSDAEARQIVDVARGLEGIVRNNSIHAAAVVIADRPLTEIVPLQLAEDRGRGGASQRRERQRQAGARLQDGDAVLDGPDRGDRPAEDGLPRTAQPRRARERGRHHRALGRRADRPRRRCRSTTARPTRCSRAATRSACSSSSPRACGTRCARCGRPSSRTSSRWSRSTARARCASSPTTRAASAIPAASRYIDERLRAITEPTYGIALYQEQLMQIARDIAGFPGPQGGHAALGDRQEEARPDGEPQGGVPRRLRGERHVAGRRRTSCGPDGGRGRLLVQQVARRLLRADRLPHRLPEGQLPGRVHGGGDLERDVDQGQGAVLRLALRGDGDRACCRRT